MNLGAVIGEVGGFLDRERLPFTVVGALALHTYGYSRATNDVDLLVGADAREPLIAFLEDRGFETLHRSDGYSNHLHSDPAFGRVDVIYVDDRTRDEILAGAKTAPVAGREVLVPRPEHLAAMKVHAMKNDPSRVFREMADLQFLMNLPGVDLEQIRSYFDKSGQLERYFEIERSM